jgi:transposase
MAAMSQPRTAEVLEFSRRAAVRGIRQGHPQSQVAALLGVSLRTVQRWWHAWREEGEAGFPMRPGRGRPPKLSCEQADEVLAWLDHSPTEYGFDTERWTAPRVAELVERLLGVRMHPRYLNDWLRSRGVTPQLPARHAWERDDARIERWKRREWPRIKKKRGT